MIETIPNFIQDAFFDSLKLVPSLFLIFVLIEIFENFFAHKIAYIVSFSKKLGTLVCALLAIIPQCGFSVIMTTLFIKRYITLGTLIAVYIATSDEAIPILITYPNQFSCVIKIILIKLFVGILSGYLIDLIIKPKLHECPESAPCSHFKNVELEKGCCRHEIIQNKIKELLIHPIKHTLIIFIFILISCIILNFILQNVDPQKISEFTNKNELLEILFFSIFGLVPNCAVSVLVTMMYLKGVISFGGVISGLCSNAGLGILVLFSKKENLKNFFIIISLLIFISFVAGFLTMLI